MARKEPPGRSRDRRSRRSGGTPPAGGSSSGGRPPARRSGRPEGAPPGARRGGGRPQEGAPERRGAGRVRREESRREDTRREDTRREAPARDEREAARPQTDVDVLAGRNAVREALRAGRRRVYRLLVAEGAQEAGALADILALAAARGLRIERADRAELDRVSAMGGMAGALAHQGVVAYASPYPYADLDEVLALAEARGEPPLVLALDSVQDPQNVGSLLRTGEAVGCHGAIIPERRAAGITSAVSRASAGAVEHLLVAEVTNLVRTLEALKERGLWIVGVEGVPEAQDYRTADLTAPLVLVVGGEGAGMRRLVRETCDLLVRLPMRGEVSSLNVSVAGSVVLYRAWEARSAGGGEVAAQP